MENIEVYINEERLDTDVSTRIAETKQINDFLEIGDRQTSYTNAISFPKTERNKALLGMMAFTGNTSLASYRVHKVTIKRLGIETVSAGIGYFKPTNARYNMYVYSENVDLFERIGNKSIADLNLESLNHTLNTANWISSFGRSDYTYPLADYGKLEDDTIEINYQVPALFLSYLWEKIFKENGFKWSYSGRDGSDQFNPFTSSDWTKLALSITEGFAPAKESVNPIKKLGLVKDKTTQYNTRTTNPLGNLITIQELTGSVSEYIRFKTDTDADGIHVFTNSSQYNRSRIRIKESGFYKINITGEFYNLNTENASLFIEKDGVNLFAVKEDFPNNQSAIGFSNKLYLRAGEEFFIKIVTLPKDNESHYSYDLNLELFLDNTVTAVNFSSYLSKIKQKDFVKDVIQYYGLLFQRSGDTYEFISLEELLDPLAKYNNEEAKIAGTVYEDWSSRFHKVNSENPKIGNYAKQNLFKYKYDNVEDTFADAVLKVDDETLKNEQTIVQRLYKAPDRSPTAIDSEFLYFCNFYEKQLNDDGSLKSVKAKKTEPYFFKVEQVQGSFSYKLAGALGSSSFSGSYPRMSFEGLDFNNVLPSRYSAFSNTLNYGKKFKVTLYLTILDIHTLDFFKLKYIKQLGGLFYLNKVSGFTGAGKTACELVRVRSIEKLGQFSDDFNEDFNI